MQPVQNITVDDRVSRTQYQYTLEDPDSNELNEWTDKFVGKLKGLKEIEDVATDQQTNARALYLSIDRVTASRLGIAPYTIDNTLYDAYGQRQINTLYTQLNQYHVILETQPSWQQTRRISATFTSSRMLLRASGAGAVSSFSASASASAGSNATTTSVLYTPSMATLSPPATALYASPPAPVPEHRFHFNAREAVPLNTFTHLQRQPKRSPSIIRDSFPAVTVSFNLARTRRWAMPSRQSIRLPANIHFPASLQSDFQGTAAAFKNSLTNEPLLILAALVTVYIVLGVLYESFIHPITILSTLPSAGVGALLAL